MGILVVLQTISKRIKLFNIYSTLAVDSEAIDGDPISNI